MTFILLEEQSKHENYGIRSNSIVFGVVKFVKVGHFFHNVKKGSKLRMHHSELIGIHEMLFSIVIHIKNGDVHFTDHNFF